MADDLGRYDDLRYDNARRTLREVDQLLESLEAHRLPLAFGINASCHRSLAQLPQARRALANAARIAEKLDDPAIFGDLNQRFAYVVLDEGRPARALHFCRQALSQHILARNLEGVGKSLVDAGVMLIYLGRLRDAVQHYKAALRYVSNLDHRYRFSAYQGKAYALCDLGRHEEALKQVERAASCRRHVAKLLGLKLDWLEARLLARLERYREAVPRFATLETAFRDAHQPLDAAIVTTEKIETLLHLGKNAEACRAANGMAAYLQPLRNNQLASGVIYRLVRQALNATLSKDLIRAVRLVLEAKETQDSKRQLQRHSMADS